MAETQILHTKASLPNGLKVRHLRLAIFGVPAVVPGVSVLASQRSSRRIQIVFSVKLHEYVEFLPFINILTARLHVQGCCRSQNPLECMTIFKYFQDI